MRFNFIVNYCSRSPIVPPFTVLLHLKYFVQYVVKKRPRYGTRHNRHKSISKSMSESFDEDWLVFALFVFFSLFLVFDKIKENSVF